MKLNLDRSFLTTSTGQLVVVGAIAVVAVVGVGWHKTHLAAKPLAASGSPKPISLPKVFTREVAKFLPPTSPTAGAMVAPAAPQKTPPVPEKPRILPLGLFAATATPTAAPASAAPYGRLIPCETLLTLESNRLDTPVIGLVTEDVWHDGHLIVPAGAEVHGRAALDRTRERLAVQGGWHIVWRTGGAAHEIQVNGLALDRDAGGDHEGSAGLRGDVLKTADYREVPFDGDPRPAKHPRRRRPPGRNGPRGLDHAQCDFGRHERDSEGVRPTAARCDRARRLLPPRPRRQALLPLCDPAARAPADP